MGTAPLDLAGWRFLIDTVKSFPLPETVLPAGQPLSAPLPAGSLERQRRAADAGQFVATARRRRRLRRRRSAAGLEHQLRLSAAGPTFVILANARIQDATRLTRLAGAPLARRVPRSAGAGAAHWIPAFPAAFAGMTNTRTASGCAIKSPMLGNARFSRRGATSSEAAAVFDGIAAKGGRRGATVGPSKPWERAKVGRSRRYRFGSIGALRLRAVRARPRAARNRRCRRGAREIRRA